MTNVIVNSDNNSVLFVNLLVGDWFNYNARLYIKVSSTQAVNLRSGLLVDFAGIDYVIKIDSVSIEVK